MRVGLVLALALAACREEGDGVGDGGGADGGGVDGGGTDGGGSDVYAGPWETLATMPEGGAWPAVGAVGGVIHVVPSNSTTHLVYDTEGAGEWTLATAAPEAAHYHAGGAVDGRFYLVGGGTPGAMDGRDWNFEYDPETMVWAEREPMPTARGYLNAAVVGDELFALGGPNIAGETINQTVEAYAPATDSWRACALMDDSTMWPLYSALGVVDDRIYKLGGGIANNPFDDAWVYDVGADTWTELDALPEADHGPAGAALDGLIYVMGGYLPDGITDRVWAYDPETETTTELDPLPWNVAYGKALAIDGCLYLVGGHDNTNEGAATGFFRWCP